jgi:hypothetical protein
MPGWNLTKGNSNLRGGRGYKEKAEEHYGDEVDDIVSKSLQYCFYRLNNYFHPNSYSFVEINIFIGIGMYTCFKKIGNVLKPIKVCFYRIENLLPGKLVTTWVFCCSCYSLLTRGTIAHISYFYVEVVPHPGGGRSSCPFLAVLPPSGQRPWQRLCGTSIIPVRCCG